MAKIQFFKNKLPMSFIDDHVLPIEFLENGFFTKQHFVGGHNDIPSSGHHCIPNEFVSRFLIANQANCAKGWTPFFELVHPIGQSGFGDQNHVGSIDVLVVFHIPQKRDGLQGFAQSHFIGQNSVDSILKKGNHPI